MPHRKRAFFVSDRTGITVEALGSSLLSQFAEMDFLRVTLPFIDTVDKAREAVAQVNEAHRESGKRPLVFSSIVDDAVRAEINRPDGLVLDVFDRFIVPLEPEGPRADRLPATAPAAQAKGVGALDRARAPAPDSQRAPARLALCRARQLPLRGGGGREAHEAGPDPISRLDHQVDRGDRHARAARGAPRAAGGLRIVRRYAPMRGRPPPRTTPISAPGEAP